MTNVRKWLRPSALFNATGVMKLAVVLGGGAMVLLLATLAYLPFQDLPQQARMLSQGRWMASGEQTEYYLKRSEVVFGYSLYRVIDQLLSPVLSADQTLRLEIVLAFVLLPLAVARVCRHYGGSPWLGALLALPLGLSSQLRLGQIPFALGLPCVFFAMGSALDIAVRPRALTAILFAVWMTLSYLCHPLAFAMAVLLVVLIWFGAGIRMPYATLIYAAGTSLAIVLLSHDLSVNAFFNIEGSEIGWPVGHNVRQELHEIFLDFLMEPFAFSSPIGFLCYLPLLVLIAFHVIVAFRAESDAFAGRQKIFLYGVVAMVVFTTVLPRNFGTVFRLPTRFALLGVLLLVVLATRALPAARASAVLSTAVLLALSSAGIELTQQSARLSQIIGPAPPRSVGGRVLAVRMNDCAKAGNTSDSWPTYDPVWHAWAYALDDQAAFGQGFYFSGYHAVQFRSERYGMFTSHGDDRLLWPSFPHKRCDEVNLTRLLWALNSKKAESVVVIDPPNTIKLALRRMHHGLLSLTETSPGLWVLKRPKK